MSLKHQHFLVVLGALLCAACAGASRATTAGTAPIAGDSARFAAGAEVSPTKVLREAGAVRRDFQLPSDRVWAVLPGAFADLGYQGRESTNGSERLYLTPALTIKGRLYPDSRNDAYLDCGRTPVGTAAANEYAVTFTVLVRVHARDGGASTLDVVVDGDARDRARSLNRVSCTGTGRLEQMFVEAVERRLRWVR